LQDILSAVSLGSIYLLFALGMSLVWGSIGILNFAHGSIFMFSAFTGYVLLNQVQLPLAALIVIGIVVGVLLSLFIQVAVFEQIQKRAKNAHMAEMQMLIGGIGIASIPLAIAQIVTLSNPFGFSNSSFKISTFTIGELRIGNIDVLIIIAALGLGAAVAVWLRRSRQGLALRSIGVDAEVSSMMGIDKRRLGLGIMGVAGGLAGLAGVLFTFSIGAITPESGETLLVKAFAIIILGGVGSTLGVAVGAYILAFAETYVLVYTSGTWVEAISFGLIFAVLLLRPAGLFGRKEVRRT
jgi:branched-chain amino acid transport system permease protein